MANRAEHPGADDWSDVEQRFFETAPPEVPQAPPPAMSFADLDPPAAVERRARPRVPWSARSRSEAGEEVPPPTAAGRALDAARRSFAALRPSRERLGRVSAALRPLGERVGRVAVAAWRGAKPSLGAARETAGYVVRVGVARFLAGLPAERPDRRTIVAVVTSLVVLTGLSAGVVASRDAGGSRGLSAATAASVLPMPVLPLTASRARAAAPEPEPAPPVAPSPASVSVSGAAPASPPVPARVAKHPQPVHKQVAAARTVASAHVPAKPVAAKPAAAKPALAKAATGPAAAKPSAIAAPGKPVAVAPGKPVAVAPGKPAVAAPLKVAASASPAKPAPVKPAVAVKPPTAHR